jgi:lipopolysaccharide transport system ATP-binding protein
MQMRLAFSVAAHLDAEILLIDEVLAVGDAEFQKKCIGKMDEVSKGEGKTIMFVSHDMNAIANLTSRGIFIKDGKAILDSHTQNTIKKYIEINTQNVEAEIRNAPRYGNGLVKISNIKIQSNKENSSFLYSLEDIEISVTLEKNTTKKIKDIKLDIGINNISGRRVAWLTSNEYQNNSLSNVITVNFKIQKIPLVPGDYNLNLYCEINNNISDWLKNVCNFKILNNDLFNIKTKIPENQGDIILQYETVC